MKRLYAVKIETLIVVAAEDRDDVISNRSKIVEQVYQAEPESINVRVMHEIDDLKKMPHNWRHSYPYGDTLQSCEEVLDALRTRCNLRVQEAE